MPDITITEDQRAYLDQLREALAAEHVGEYGHVRFADALQYLMDVHGPPEDLDVGSESKDGGGEADDGEDDEETAEAEDPGDGDDGGVEDRLSAMMSLLDTHDDKWRETDAEGGRYEVDLPDGETEVARTKDDVRAALFQHYG